MDQAKNTILHGSSEVCEYNVYGEEYCALTKSIGFPTLLSIPFIVLGLNNMIAMWFSILFASLLIVVVYLFGKTYFKDEKVGLLIALVVLLSNLHIKLSSHVENIHAALIFAGISMIALILYQRTKRFDYSLLTITAFLLSIFIRVEFVLFIIPISLVYLQKLSMKKETIIPVGLLISVLSLFVFQLSTIASIGYNSGFSLTNLVANFSSMYIGIYEIIIVLLAIIGIWSFGKKSTPLLFALIITIIFYFTWTQTNLARVTFTPLIILLIFVAGGLEFIFEKHKGVFYLTLLLLIGFFIYRHSNMVTLLNYNTVEQFNTDVLSELDFEDGCYVIVERPVFITATHNIKAIPTMNALSDIGILTSLVNKECVLFFENNYCYQKLDVGPGRDKIQMNSPARCDQIKKYFRLNKIQQFNGYGQKYYLYEVNPE